MQDALLLHLSERRDRLSQQINERMASGLPITDRLLKQFNATAAAYATARQRVESDLSKVRRSPTPSLTLKIRLPVDDYLTLQQQAKRQHRPAATLARMLLCQWTMQRRHDASASKDTPH
jgi:thymidylate kinase